MNKLVDQKITNYKRTVLIIEDNDINREILKSILEDKYQILEATNGKEGLDILKANTHVNLILLDIQMPVMDGFEFLRQTRGDQIFEQIPIIVTTSDSSEEENCLTLGASDFVSKPYSPNIILKRVEALIRLKESTNALYETRIDQTTGLYNRAFFHYVSDQLLQSEFKDDLTYILLYIRDFSFINTAYGEKDTDRLLYEIGQILKNYDNKAITMSRYGGDSFAFVINSNLEYKKAIEDVEKEIQKLNIVKNLRIRFAIYEKVDKSLTTHVIVNRLFTALFSKDVDSAQDVILFDHNMLEKEERKHLIYETMEESLKNEEFKVYFQPKHDCKTGILKGAEGLVRWFHPTLGFISPGDFIPAFEEHGFITKLDFYIFEKTCEFLDKIQKMGLKPVPISINLSRRDLADFTEIEKIESVFKKYNVSKDLLHFEITESLCGDSAEVFRKVKVLRSLGVKIEIDDFGSGYSSLGMISDIPMDYLKLDISFAKRINQTREVVKHVISLAHSLNAITVAEGVETQEQLNIYKELGCDLIQGYFFSKPLSEEEFIKYLKEKEH